MRWLSFLALACGEAAELHDVVEPDPCRDEGLCPGLGRAVAGGAFADVSGAEPRRWYVSNGIPIGDVGTSVEARLETDVEVSSLVRNDEELLGTVATFEAGDRIGIRMRAPDGASERRTTAVAIDGAVLPWSITTAADRAADPFTFDPITGAELDALVTSSEAVIDGISGVETLTVSGDGDPTWVADDALAGLPAIEVAAGARVRIMVRAAAEPLTVRTLAVRLGDYATSFEVTTRAPYAYAWSEGAWRPCSSTCGDGVRDRDVWCRRSDGAPADDALCAGERPSSSEACTDRSSCPIVAGCAAPAEGRLCLGNVLDRPNPSIGVGLYWEAPSWDACVDMCQRTPGVTCCMWIPRNLGFCGAHTGDPRDDYEGSVDIFAAACQ
jgi:hypothetical protein